MKNIEKYLDSVGPLGSIQRLQTIADLNLGKRSFAAQRTIEKRNRRKELIELGFSFEIACLIVNKEYLS